MDIQDRMVEHLELDAELTAEQAARILVGAASYVRDALRALDECTRPELDQVALHDLARRAGDIETRLRVLHRVTVEACANWPVGDIPALVEANVELAARCRALIHQRRIDVEHEVMILRAPLPAYGLPC
jgi:hypothetical protein